MPIGKRNSVFRPVEGYPWVVAHATVDGDEGTPAGLCLDAAYLVHGDTGPRADRPAGLDHDGRPGETFGGAGLVQGILDHPGQFVDAELRVTGQIRNPVAATDIQLSQDDAVPGADVG